MIEIPLSGGEGIDELWDVSLNKAILKDPMRRQTTAQPNRTRIIWIRLKGYCIQLG